MFDFFGNILSSGGFEPHSAHFVPDNLNLMRTLVATNILIGLTYLIIPAELFYIYIKRKDFSFRWVFLVIVIFGVWCSAGHFTNALVFFYPAYWLQAFIDMGTGIVSFLALLAYTAAVPIILKLSGPAGLVATNSALSKKMTDSREMISDLEASTAEFEKANSVLSVKNAELREANKQMVDRELKIVELKEKINKLNRSQS